MDILKKPLITEKASALSEKAGKYTFLVSKKGK
jgi:ribosomal protein L23